MSDLISPKDSAKWKAFGVNRAGKSDIRILTVGDNEALRYSLVHSLRDAGYQVIEAKNGREALAIASGELPDLITLDVNLPDMDGFEVCRQLKANPATNHIPIVHVSSTFVDPESRVQGLAGGADAYLAEPINRAELVATVGALLRLKQAETAARQQAEAAEMARQELAQLNATLELRVGERTAELKAANDSLRELSVRLLQMQDEERRRIARELHDSVGQLLVAISMNNASLGKEADHLSAEARKALTDNDSMVDEILRSIRTISHLLHPPLLDESGLPSALRWYVEEFSQRSGILVTLECSPSFERFSSELETAIFRIVQECLGNIHRHSQSPTATIHLEASAGSAHLVVSDEGRGMSVEKQKQLKSGIASGVGLRGMRERVAQLGGELQVESTSHGTKITASLPYMRNDSEAAGEDIVID
jgi:signal transduction histidine kinase